MKEARGIMERVGNPKNEVEGKLGLSRNFPKVVAQHLVTECGFCLRGISRCSGSVLCAENMRGKMAAESDP